MGHDADYRAIAEKSKGIKQSGFPELDPGHPGVTLKHGGAVAERWTRCTVSVEGSTASDLWLAAEAAAARVADGREVVNLDQDGRAIEDTTYGEFGGSPIIRGDFTFRVLMT